MHGHDEDISDYDALGHMAQIYESDDEQAKEALRSASLSGALDPLKEACKVGGFYSPLPPAGQRSVQKRYVTAIKNFAYGRLYRSDLSNSFIASAQHPVVEKLANAWSSIKSTFSKSPKPDAPNVDHDGQHHDM